MNIDLQMSHPGASVVSPSTHHPYTSSLSSSASSSSSSVFSVDAISSQSSASSGSSDSRPISWDADDIWTRPQSNALTHQAENVIGVAPESDERQNGCGRFRYLPTQGVGSIVPASGFRAPRCLLPPLKTDIPVAPEQRQHPRRCSSTANQRPPPALVRQSERKVNFVDSLVDSATQMVEVIWPLSVPPRCTAASAGRGVLPLRTFIQETLRRSRTSYSTLQVALYYLVLIKAHVPKHDFTMEQPEDTQSLRALQCGRRMFLAALILASKYLQDRNYSARAWSKISGLKVCEINTNEMAFLHAVNWKLHIVDPIFERWQHIVLNYTPAHPPPSPGSDPMSVPRSEWKAIVPLLTPQLDTIDTTPRPTSRVPYTRPLTPARSATSPLTSCYSNDATPTPTTQLQPPRFLEPRPDLLPPTPPLPRMGPLPTPQLTPQSATSSTPAAGLEAFALRRPSMCSAMAQAQSLSMARCTMEFKPSGLEAYQLSSRRPSLAPSSSSLSSSPESMISDNSRFSSRASSISSVSSAAWAPTGRPQLARLATCRNAGLPYVAPCKEKENMGYLPAEPLSAIDFTGLQLMESEATSLPHRPKAATEAPAQISPTRGRKRGRSSVDLAAKQAHLYRQVQLERETRELLQSSPTPMQDTVLPDRSVAQSFLVQTPESYAAESKALQSPLCATAPERRMPLQKELGRKRACCATEAAHVVLKEGPGMWEGILW